MELLRAAPLRIRFLSLIRGQSGGFGTGGAVLAASDIPQASAPGRACESPHLQQQTLCCPPHSSKLRGSFNPLQPQFILYHLCPTLPPPCFLTHDSLAFVVNSSSWLQLPLTPFSLSFPLPLLLQLSQCNPWQWKVTPPSRKPPLQVQVQLPMTSCLVAAGNQTAGT